ncbi:type VI secretion system tube protein TssD [Segetibacter sp. 3557_3]|uniref:type VI secretion system tube protein TssD n=1 Tax=Segetibacter sp. 3557_3 TaxID=2547429 RepID=UPI001404B9A8|nr:type VI secretion system tube protein TssD [Segetibacter sp. 3557_3]
MAFELKLKVAGLEVNVLNLDYGLNRETDATGLPSEVTRAGKITLTVQSTSDTTFFEWMCNNFERKDGSIVFVKRDNESTQRELKFTEAYMVQYHENFNSTGVDPVTQTFTISAKSIEMGTGGYTNKWVQ